MSRANPWLGGGNASQNESYFDPRTGKYYRNEADADAAFYATPAGKASQSKEGDSKALKDLEAEYLGIEKSIGDQYTEDAKRAGTYSDTAEFQAGHKSNVGAGVKGAQTANLQKQNTMRRALGLPPITGMVDPTTGGAPRPQQPPSFADQVRAGTFQAPALPEGLAARQDALGSLFPPQSEPTGEGSGEAFTNLPTTGDPLALPTINKKLPAIGDQRRLSSLRRL